MGYGSLTIDTFKSNRGNRLIEYALQQCLGLEKPEISISMFKTPSADDIQRLNNCQFVLLPGSTILAKGKGQSEAMESLSKIKVPKFCVGASYWFPKFELNKEVLKHITEPIGVRDPLTHQACKKAGFDSILVGCPTAYLPTLSCFNQDYSIVGFSRTYMNWQVNYFKSIYGHKVAALQEELYEKPYAEQCTQRTFNYDDPQKVMQLYSDASHVYTGRLHGVLPALAQKRPVTFFGDAKDSRFSLLAALGIAVNPLGADFPRVSTEPSKYLSRLDELEQAFYSWKKRTIDLISTTPF